MSLVRPFLIILAPIAGVLAVIAMVHQPEHPAAPAPAGTIQADAAGVLQLTGRAFPSVKYQPKPVLIDFWAPWCGPCRQQGPLVEQVSGKVGGDAIVAKVNVDEERDLASQFEVRAIPTLVVLKNGKVVQRFVGVQSAETLLGALQSAGR